MGKRRVFKGRTFNMKVCVRCGSEFRPTGSSQKYCINCKKAASLEVNRDARLERMRARWAAHTPEDVLHKHEYYAKHRDEVLRSSRKWAVEHPDKRLEVQRKYRGGHIEKLSLANSAYKKSHPEKVRQWNEKRRALQYDKTPIAELLTEAQWRDILDQYRHRCAYCGKKSERLTMDHVIPLSKGGKHSANNVVPACQHCNSSKGAKTPEEWFGLKVANG